MHGGVEGRRRERGDFESGRELLLMGSWKYMASILLARDFVYTICTYIQSSSRNMLHPVSFFMDLFSSE